MGPNLFRPPRIRSALTAIKKLIQLFMIVILLFNKNYIGVTRPTQVGEKEPNYVEDARNTRESRTDDFPGWAVTHQQTHTFLFIYYYFILRVFVFLVWEAPDKNRLNRDSVLIERLYIHRVRERERQVKNRPPISQ